MDRGTQARIEVPCPGRPTWRGASFRRCRPPGAATLLSMILASGAVACGGAPQESPVALDPVPGAATGVVAFVGVNVLPMDREEVLEDRTVLVQGGRVTEMGPSEAVELPPGARVVQGAGRWLLPGLAEMHAHIPGPGAPMQVFEDLFFLYLANGVTTIRGMAGAPNHLELRERVASGELVGPTVFAAAPSLNGDSAPDAATAESLVRAHAAEGYDLLKLHPGLSREVYDQIVETANEVGITWAGHVSPAVGLEHALATGKSTVDHLDGYLEAAASPEIRERALQGEPVPLREVLESVTPERVRELAEATRSAGTWNVPTMYLWENFYNERPPEELAALPEMQYASPPQLQQWTQQKESRFFADLLEGWRTDGALGADDLSPEDGASLIRLRREILAALDEADAPLLMGTDSPQMFMVPGFALHHEIQVMTNAGLSPYRILRSGTRNVGAYAEEELGAEIPSGTVSVGARADLILAEGNPLEDLGTLRSPAGVMVRGHWLPAEALQEGLTAIEARMGGGG
jgi:imidazolonepropionase-like amidohydrolase